MQETFRRGYDVLARTGTDTFAVVMPITPEHEARRLSDGFRERVRILEELSADFSPSTAFSLDAGCASVVANRETAPRELVQKAEKALLNA